MTKLVCFIIIPCSYTTNTFHIYCSNDAETLPKRCRKTSPMPAGQEGKDIGMDTPPPPEAQEPDNDGHMFNNSATPISH